MLKTAKKYLERGWSVIPITKGSKIPAISQWTKYQTQKPTIEEVTKWWTDMPEAGIALVCGKVSDVIVVDIDSGKGEPDTKNLELPPTLSTKTGGGGRHLIYKWRKGLIGAKVGVRKLIDIRSDNSYIVLPPSLHHSGKNYEWILEDEEPIEAPKWLESATTEGKEETDWDQFLNDKKVWGIQNDSATKVAGKIMYEMSKEMWEPLGFPAFQAWNKNINTPPLPDKELKTVWNSVKKMHLKSSTKKIKDEEIVEESENTDDEEKEIVKAYLKNKTEGTYLIAKYIVKKYSIITVGEKEREMFVYQNGYYRPAENTVIFPEVQRILEQYVNKNAKLETFHKIADMTSYNRDIFTKTDTDLIPLKNGVYNFKTKKLLPHSPEYKFTYQFPISYNPSSVCPKTEAFFKQILSPEQQLTFEEWLGYYFLRNYMFKKAMIFVGDGDTGKTTLLEVITYLLGKENLSSISLQKMSTDKFSAAHLYEKHGNLVDELSARDITDTGTFKVATGGGSITGEYKFGNQFSFLNFSKFTFACNRIPDVNSDANDGAYFNRWIITRFENTITKKIPNFISTLTTEEERSGLFNLAMVGLKRLLEQGRFTYNYTADETKNEMLRSGSSLAMFASDMLERADDEEMSKEDMYLAYTDYCKLKNVSSQTKDMLGKKLTDYAPYAIDGLITDMRAKQVRGWRNVKIRSKTLAEGEVENNQSSLDNF